MLEGLKRQNDGACQKGKRPTSNRTPASPICSGIHLFRLCPKKPGQHGWFLKRATGEEHGQSASKGSVKQKSSCLGRLLKFSMGNKPPVSASILGVPKLPKKFNFTQTFNPQIYFFTGP